MVLPPPVGGFRVQKNGGRSVFSVSLEETIAPGMDSKQPQVTSGEPAVNISGKLSLRQQVFTLYIIYIYILYLYIYIYLLMPQPTQRAHRRVKVVFQGSRQGRSFEA